MLSSCWDAASERTQFRMQCGTAGECLPFFVYLRDSLEADAVSCRLSASRPLQKIMPKLVVRAGDRAVAEFVSAQLRMSASVVCLERGREGDVIRVRSAEGRIFRARISGPARLEAVPQ